MIGTTNYEHDKNNDKHVKDHNDDGEDAWPTHGRASCNGSGASGTASKLTSWFWLIIRETNGLHKPLFLGGGSLGRDWLTSWKDLIFSGEREFYSQYKFYAAFESFGPQKKANRSKGKVTKFKTY